MHEKPLLFCFVASCFPRECIFFTCSHVCQSNKSGCCVLVFVCVSYEETPDAGGKGDNTYVL